MDTNDAAYRLKRLSDVFTIGIFGVQAMYQGEWGIGMDDEKFAISRKDNENLITPISAVAEQLEDNAELAADAEIILALSLLGYSGEIVKECDVYDSKLSQLPEVQFLRHCRNAAFHGNEFTFKSNQPDKTAKWNGKEITRSLQGTNLLRDFMEVGDAMALLDDIIDILKDA